MAIIEILEAVMIISFGASWPMNVIKSIRMKSTKGKSLLFLLLIEIGYIAGVTGKILGATSGEKPLNWVFIFYCLNLFMVSLDLVLYFINLSREKKNKETKTE